MPKVSVELDGFVIDPDAHYDAMPIPGNEIAILSNVTHQHYKVEKVEQRDVREGDSIVRKTFVVVSQL